MAGKVKVSLCIEEIKSPSNDIAQDTKKIAVRKSASAFETSKMNHCLSDMTQLIHFIQCATLAWDQCAWRDAPATKSQ